MTGKHTEKIAEAIKKSGKVTIISHPNPDGDAIGSSLALYHYLKQAGKTPQVIVPTAFPDFLGWMPGAENILVYENDADECLRQFKDTDLIICADFNTPDRLEGMQEAFKKSGAQKIMIDHHIDRGHFCDLEYKTTAVSSTAELVYTLLSEIEVPGFLSPEMAECLFVGIMTDTGSFSYACNYQSTFRVVSQLVATGIDAERIHRLVYDTYSENRLRLLGYCLSEKLQVYHNFHTAFIALSMQDLDRFQHKTGDTEGIVNYTLGIKGIVFGALITEREEKVKISLRSKGDFDVNQIARRHFRGGGHVNAAGGELYCTFEEAVRLFIDVIPQYLPELKKAAK